MALFIEIILIYLYSTSKNTIQIVPFLKSILKSILTYGAWGPGGYYPIIYIQILIWIPILYTLFKRNPLSTFISVILINICFEIFAHNMLTEQIYRLLSFRYIIFILLGMVLYLYEDCLSNTYIPHISLLVGIIYLIYVNYIDYSPTFFTWWTGTAMPTAFYSFGVVLFFKKLERHFQKFHYLLRPITFIGEASYQIFFVQMIFFGPLQNFSPNLAIINEHIRIRYTFLLSLIFCVSIGCIWYKLESSIFKVTAK